MCGDYKYDDGHLLLKWRSALVSDIKTLLPPETNTKPRGLAQLPSAICQLPAARSMARRSEALAPSTRSQVFNWVSLAANKDIADSSLLNRHRQLAPSLPPA